MRRSVLYPKGDDCRLGKLQMILKRTHSRAHVTCYWRGDPGEPAPQIAADFQSALGSLAADLEIDFTVANHS
jgi:hypothetical protein